MRLAMRPRPADRASLLPWRQFPGATIRGSGVISVADSIYPTSAAPINGNARADNDLPVVLEEEKHGREKVSSTTARNPLRNGGGFGVRKKWNVCKDKLGSGQDIDFR
jgi:hypothetical protein